MRDQIHTGMMVTGLSTPYYLTKCKKIKIEIIKSVAMQVFLFVIIVGW